ncbi:hypothetical protein CA983_33995 [Streptomyces swartbergensis]|uniref:Uncharacterized protein n=1 Tax=Streptomyces swartbergensis TaxID=487165 RepID=A0A243RJV8_9ACTN|nr:hypothetical protein CA983_33995 [Streptomyces swartbergensis]
MRRPTPPPVTELTYGQYQGWHCCWCSASLRGGGVPAGIAPGQAGAYDLSINVYACGPRCPKRPRQTKTPAPAGTCTA